MMTWWRMWRAKRRGHYRGGTLVDQHGVVRGSVEEWWWKQ